MRLFTGYEDKENVKIHNKNAILKAAELLRQGHVVIIFPDGGSNNPAYWYSGIGEIIKELSGQNIPIQLLATQINGISSTNLVKHFLFNKKSYLYRHPVQVTISDPFTPESVNITHTQPTGEITDQLRKEFNNKKFWTREYAYVRA
jgi:1-acyl-sn-glycerol-3-phosphate acyltransferase